MLSTATRIRLFGFLGMAIAFIYWLTFRGSISGQEIIYCIAVFMFNGLVHVHDPITYFQRTNTIKYIRNQTGMSDGNWCDDGRTGFAEKIRIYIFVKELFVYLFVLIVELYLLWKLLVYFWQG